MSKEFKIGVFAVTVLVASFFLINYLRGEDIFNNEIELVSRYDNVEGLVPSAPVFIKGYKAGKVTEVRYDSQREDFEVTCSIRKEFRIPEDSRMTIYSVDIMGGKGVRIDLGHSQVAAVDGGSLAPAFEAGLMDGLASGVEPLLAKVNATMDSLAVTVSGVNRLLCSENTDNISRTIAHLEKTMASANSIASEINGKSEELADFIDNLGMISSHFASVSEKLDTTMNDVGAVMSSLTEAQIGELVNSFKALLESINNPDGTVGQLLVNNSMYSSIDSLLDDVDSLIRKIEENPKKYLRISVF
ncbi:MAG: MCE family protein [Bacteroidales bacterium]|nr:MCE family protein [Bacteroidales bacterium]